MNNPTIDIHGRVVLVTLDRPASLNALSHELMTELNRTLFALDNDPKIGCIILTGNGRAFSAGADISELASKSHSDVCRENLLSQWDHFAALRTPKIAAVNGYALAAGCELAMMRDIIFASESAQFGQPEIKLGLIPGMGGTQKLSRLVGKAKAMDMILTGRIMNAAEALTAGLAARVIADEGILSEVLATAKTIANYSKHTAITARETVNQALEVGLNAGIQFERRNYHALSATSDAHEGMQAFLEKRTAEFHTPDNSLSQSG